VIDPRAVLSRSAGERTKNPAEAIRVGAALGARYAAIGTVVASLGEIRFTTEVYDVRSRELVASARAGGAADSLPAIVESLARQIADETDIGSRASAALNFRRITTGSVAALKYYLRGERHLRRSEWNRAMVEYERALDADSAFALAFYRLALANDWNSARHLPGQSEYIDRASRYAANLPQRGRLLIEGYAQLAEGSQAAIGTLQEMVALYPDDVDGWFLLGDAYYHLLFRTRPEEFRDAMTRAIELDSTFAPAYVHLMEDAFARRDTASLARWIAGLRAAEPGSPLLSGYDWAAALRPDPAVAQAGEDSATEGPVVDRTPRTQSPRQPTLPDRPVESEPAPTPSQPLGRDAATPDRSATVVDSPRVAMPPSAPPVVRTQVEEAQPAPPPTAIAEAVLARLKVAIEQEDLRAVRSVWTTLTSQESQSFRLLFDAVRDLSVSYVIQGVDRTNGRIQVRVQTTYTFYNEREQQRSRSITNQSFDLAQQGGGWVIGQ
jgi:tetratricopeptide (TPR) repeat protein